MKIARAAVVVTMSMTIKIDAPWVAVEDVGCIVEEFVVFASTK
jgi:hypothetical protein